MDKKRVVFLFGAGAALDWGGPQTICNRDRLTFLPEYNDPTTTKNRVCCLTHLVRETGFKSQSGKRISEIIYQRLVEIAPEHGQVNFETILNVLDQLVAYSGDNSKIDLFSFLKLAPRFKDELFNYNIIRDPITKFFTLSIPGMEFPRNTFSNDKNPDQEYAAWLFKDFFNGFIGHVSKYSYHTSTYNVIFQEVNDKKNDLFSKWINSFREDHAIRMYTLNYDRLFKNILEREGMEIFEGFDLENLYTEGGGKCPSNIERIIMDTESDCYYNLHGCVNWYVDETNENQTSGYQYWMTGAPNSSNSSAYIEIEKGRKLLLTNIITGYQKVQRTSLSPFRQMFSAFDRDCLLADEIFIVGYSYADEHINDIIRNARKYNFRVKITLINPSFDDGQFMLKFLLNWGKVNDFIYQNQGDDVVAKQYNLLAIRSTFYEFLEKINLKNS